MQKWLWLSPLVLSACVNNAPLGPQLPTTHRIKLSVLSAELNHTRADGSPWHTKKPKDFGPLVGVALWSLGVPAEAAALATNLLKNNSPKTIPPSPKVSISIGTDNHQTPALYTSLNPQWDYQLMVDTRGRSPETPVQLLLRDQDGGEVLGEFKMTLGQLLGKQEHNLSNENVRSMLVKVEPLPAEPEYKTYQVTIPANAPAWKDVRVLNGDTVRISVTGTVCPSSWNRDTCSGPNGFDSDWLSYNFDEFRSFPHASAIAMLAGEPLFVGEKTEFIVKEPGILLIGINDYDSSNNTGEFQVTVEVNPFVVKDE